MDFELTKTNTKIATEAVSDELAFPGCSFACETVLLHFSKRDSCFR